MEKFIRDYYYQATGTPWGRLFYDCLFHQLKIKKESKILDYGSGFGITSAQYEEENDVIAVEPNVEMLEFVKQDNSFFQIVGSEDILDELPANHFDWIFCHNVLEYIDDQEEIVYKLLKLLKKGGKLSVVKHNKTGAIIQEAVLMDQPGKAIEMINKRGGEMDKTSYFGKINYYSIAQLKKWCGMSGASSMQLFGIRSMYGLSQNNDMKNTKEWYKKMLTLELGVATQEPFFSMAFYHHAIIEKK